MTRIRSAAIASLGALAWLLLSAACARPTPATNAERDTAPVQAEAPVAAEEGVSLYDLPSSWVDQTGAKRELADFRGGVRVVALVYTSCQATCPLIVADLKRIESSVDAAKRDSVRFILVSIDPDRDTPGKLAQWAERTQLDPARWTLLNGSADAVRELAATVSVRYQQQADGEMAHTNAITVLDRDGGIVHQQLGLGEPAAETAARVAALLR